jgi:hypothetical protein
LETIEAGVVAEEESRELGRRRHRRGRHRGGAERREAFRAGARDAEAAGGLVAVLAVVVGDRQVAAAGERLPLPELVGSGLLARVDGRRRVWVGARSSAREAGPASLGMLIRILLLQTPTVLTPV